MHVLHIRTVDGIFACVQYFPDSLSIGEQQQIRYVQADAIQVGTKVAIDRRF